MWKETTCPSRRAAEDRDGPTVVERIIVTIHGPGFQDFEEMEVLRLPDEGELISTKYDSCIVTSVELTPDIDFLGKVDCRIP